MMRKLIKLILVFVIPAILGLVSVGVYKYSQAYSLFEDQKIETITYDEYTIAKTESWANRFEHLSAEGFNEQKRKAVSAHDHYLEVLVKDQKYVIEYEYEVDQSIIEDVTEVVQKGDKTKYTGRYLLVKYHNFVEIVYFDLKKEQEEATSSPTYESEVCLQLPIDASDNVLYHIDDSNNIWIVTLSMNKIIFIQIYSCIEGKLIKEYRYALENNTFISQIHKILKKNPQCMQIQVITYGLTKVDVEVCPESDWQQVKEVAHHKSSEVKYTKKEVKQWKSYTPVEKDQQKNQFLSILNYLLDLYEIDYEFQVPQQPAKNPRQDIYEYFNTISVDEKNQYLITLSSDKPETGIISLDRYLINSKTPLFHGNPDFDQYSILEMMKKESKGETNPQFVHRYIDPKLNQTKQMKYKGAFKTTPNFKIEHVGLGEKSLMFWPDKKLEDTDYLAIRTREGALITHKSELKGVYGELPVAFEQINQRVDEKPQEVVQGIYQFHAKQLNLISRPVFFDKYKQVGKVQLINLLSGKAVATHYIKIKEGYRYTSSFLLNNEWWILQYNSQLKTSTAKKYEFYIMANKPDKVISLQMTYGDLSSQDHQFGEDDLAALMERFNNEHANGYMLLSVYRCVDQYYYIEFTDASAKVYGVARIHFTKMSNRVTRQSQTITDNVKKQLLLQPSQVQASVYDTKPYAVALKNTELFQHLIEFQKKEAITNKVWYSFCKKGGKNFRRLDKIDKYYYFPQHNYAVGDYGCDFNSDEPHSQRIYSFNMRNLIIHGRLNNQTVQDIRRTIVYIIFSLFPIYGICILIFLLCAGGAKEGVSEEKQLKEEKRQKKKKKE